MVLDKDCDNRITFIEFEAAFGEYFKTGGPVKDVEDKDMEDLKMSLADKAKLKKEMKEEQKKAQVYTDNTLEELSIEEIEKRNKALVEKIKDGSIETKVLNGELVIKLLE